MAQYVIFRDSSKEDPDTQRAMGCFYNDNTKQEALMHSMSIDRQVKKWQESNLGNPPRFFSTVRIVEFTNRHLNFSNI